MPTWTKSTNNSAVYDENLGSTDWDAEWDLAGNVPTTFWDIGSNTNYTTTTDSSLTYTETTDTTMTYSDTSDNAVTWSEA